MAEKNEELTIEEGFRRLDETIEKLESRDITLEEAFQAYSQGMELLKRCNDQIDRVEKQVYKLAEDGSMTELEEMQQYGAL